VRRGGREARRGFWRGPTCAGRKIFRPPRCTVSPSAIPCEEGAGGELVGYEVRGSKKESSSKPTATKCIQHWVLTLLKTRSIPSCQKTGNLRQPELEFHPPTPIPARCDHAHSPTLPSSPLSCVFMPATLRAQTAPATRGC
jgi:hypothetical protein